MFRGSTVMKTETSRLHPARLDPKSGECYEATGEKVVYETVGPRTGVFLDLTPGPLPGVFFHTSNTRNNRPIPKPSLLVSLFIKIDEKIKISAKTGASKAWVLLAGIGIGSLSGVGGKTCSLLN